MKPHLRDSSRRPSSDADTFVNGVLINHEGRISSLETSRAAEASTAHRPFEIRDLMSWLPGLVALLLALFGKISWLQYLGVTGFGK